MTDRFATEDAVSRVIQDAVRANGRNWSQTRADIAAGVQRELETHMAIVILLLMGDDETLFADYVARQQSHMIANRLAIGLTERLAGDYRTQEPGVPIEIDPARADGIAVTEVTRATTAAETAAREALGQREDRERQQEPDGQPPGERPPRKGPLDVRASDTIFWQTYEDERVCPICKPLNHLPYDEWASIYPEGPPAHPRCRCYLIYPPR